MLSMMVMTPDITADRITSVVIQCDVSDTLPEKATECSTVNCSTSIPNCIVSMDTHSSDSTDLKLPLLNFKQINFCCLVYRYTIR